MVILQKKSHRLRGAGGRGAVSAVGAVSAPDRKGASRPEARAVCPPPPARAEDRRLGAVGTVRAGGHLVCDGERRALRLFELFAGRGIGPHQGRAQ